jgi:hypothetical protein
MKAETAFIVSFARISGREGKMQLKGVPPFRILP